MTKMTLQTNLQILKSPIRKINKLSTRQRSVAMTCNFEEGVPDEDWDLVLFLLAYSNSALVSATGPGLNIPN